MSRERAPAHSQGFEDNIIRAKWFFVAKHGMGPRGIFQIELSITVYVTVLLKNDFSVYIENYFVVLQVSN